MPDIFISYSSHDRLQALSLAEKLRASGYDPWIDQHQIHGANRWGKEIVQAINGSKLVAVLISSSSLLSENVVKELNLAAERHKHLLPIMLEETELTEEFAYHLTGLHQVAIENTESILMALEQLKIRTAQTDTPIRPSAYTPASKDIRLAVLPFDDLSKEHDNEWFADGMLDELITTLGALEHIKVPSRTDVMYYKKHHPRAQEIASDLNVRYLVGGSVRKAGDKIRITASLTDAFSNAQLWTNHYDGNFDDIFELQERVSKEITETLKLRLTPEEKKIIEEQPTQNAEAYELYLRGMEYRYKFSQAGYETALNLFEQAISIDPKYIDAYITIAVVCSSYYREFSREGKWLNRAEENLQKAEKLSGKTAKSIGLRGLIAWQWQDFEKAEQLLKEATELDPTYIHNYNALGNVYMKSGKTKDAVQAFQHALLLEESYIAYFNFLVALSEANDPPKLKESALLALPIMEKHLKNNPDDSYGQVGYAYALYWADCKQEAIQHADMLSGIEELDGQTLYNLGSLYSSFGLPKKNIELLRKGIAKGFREIESFRNDLMEDPDDQAELEQLIKEVELLIQQENSGYE